MAAFGVNQMASQDKAKEHGGQGDVKGAERRLEAKVNGVLS